MPAPRRLQEILLGVMRSTRIAGPGHMRENRFFVLSTDLSDCAPVDVGGTSAISSYARLAERLEALCGRDCAALFGEPVPPRGAQTPGAAISWYGAREGQPVELIAIDEVARRPIAERLAERLNALAPALRDPETGPLVAAALCVPSEKSALAIGGEPLLVNWGHLPAGAGRDAAARRRHYLETLGRYAPALADLIVPPPAPATAPPSGSLAGAAPPRSATDVAPDAPARWPAPLLATLIAAATLLLLLWPGVLAYPDGAAVAARDQFETERLKKSNESLEAQLDALQKAAQEKVCRADGGASVPVPGLPADGGGGDQPPPRMELLPRPPDQAPLPPRAGEPAPAANVADLLEKSTVLVLVQMKATGQSTGGVSQGSGFFISDRHVVTNRHVVQGGDEDLVFIASKAVGGARRARILGVTPPAADASEFSPDFAVLEVEPPSAVKPLALGVAPPKLSTAYVAGFPGFLVAHDNAYERFWRQLKEAVSSGEGDRALAAQGIETPSADLRYGRINNVMRVGRDELPVVIHDMQLAHGNSGGPLVDACGRLGGVNTGSFFSKFNPKDPEPMQQGNVAQDVSALRKFLTDRQIAFSAEDAPCAPGEAPRAAGPAPPPAAGGAK
jgi:S1-C subfamily serine protease